MGDGQALGNKADMARLRRVALASQGLSQAAPFGRGPQGVTRAISHIGYVQIDTISVVERAHHHVLASRVPNYAPKTLNRLLKKGEIFELKTELNSEKKEKKREAVKKVIASMTVGKDVR